MTRVLVSHLMLGLLALAGAAWAESPPPYLTKWGSPGSGDGQFGTPVGVAVDDSGNVYVTDENNSRIQKFTSTGTFLETWGWGVATGADTFERCTSGCQQGIWGSGDGQFKVPFGIAVDDSGNVYVGEGGIGDANNRIQKFTSTGVFLTKWGSQGSGDGQFAAPLMPAVDPSRNVVVADVSNNRIQKFTSTGVFLTKWGSPGSGDGQFDYPIGIGADRNCNVVVADAQNYRVQEFTSTGAFVTKWGSQGSADGQFGYPYAVALGGTGNVYVADIANTRIQKFGWCSTGDAVVAFAPGRWTAGIGPDQCLGPPDGDAIPLGYLGQITIHLSDEIQDRPGPDLAVYENGHRSPPAIDENYRVEASDDGVNFALLGDAPGDLWYFDLAAGGLAAARYVRITDLPPLEQTGDFDTTVVGADIDAVVGLSCFTTPLLGVSAASWQVRLSSAFPNPTLGRAMLRLELPHQGYVHAVVYDVAGRLVREIADGLFAAGIHSLSWDGADADRGRVGPGLYFCRIAVGRHQFNRAIVVIR